MATQRTLLSTVEIISDPICPWCYIGKRRLERAFELLDRPSPLIQWKPFQLNPDMPPGGLDRREYRTRKFGSWEYSLQLDAQVGAAGAEVGISFQHDRIARTPNTFASHKLIWFAGTRGRQDAIVETLFRAYFIDGLDIGDFAQLVTLAEQAGLKTDEARAALEDEVVSCAVREEEQHALALGLTGVPTFVIAGEPIASGAQPERVLAEILAQQC